MKADFEKRPRNQKGIPLDVINMADYGSDEWRKVLDFKQSRL